MVFQLKVKCDRCGQTAAAIMQEYPDMVETKLPEGWCRIEVATYVSQKDGFGHPCYKATYKQVCPKCAPSLVLAISASLNLRLRWPQDKEIIENALPDDRDIAATILSAIVSGSTVAIMVGGVVKFTSPEGAPDIEGGQ